MTDTQKDRNSSESLNANECKMIDLRHSVQFSNQTQMDPKKVPQSVCERKCMQCAQDCTDNQIYELQKLNRMQKTSKIL